jgi:membrane-associated phospholipid phosphatase
MLFRPWPGYCKSISPSRRARTRRPGRPRLSVEPLEDRCVLSADVVLQWNQVLLDTAKADRVLPVAFPRDAAIVHSAIYDAVNAIDRSYTPLFAHVQASHGASLEAAAAQAAHDTLAALFPAHQPAFDATLAADLAGIPPGRARQGVAVGRAVAQQILAWRATDGSDAQVSYVPGTGPGVWQPTPPAFAPAVAPQWGQVTPFAIPSDSAFRPPPPPALTSAQYTAAFDEVKSLGAANSTTRTAEQSEIARFWYGAAGTFTAGGYWDQIAQGVAQQRGDSLVQNARLFALLNLAQADSTFAVWDAKYTYNFWRPVTAIRAADSDGNPATAPDPAWTPFLVTPAHPSYISGHSGVSGASAAVLAAFFGSDAIPFSLSSDSLPGVTRSFASFSATAQECSDSRVYAGIHWRFDVAAGQAVGGEVGTYVASHFLLPASGSDDEGGDRSVAAAVASSPTGSAAGVVRPSSPLPAPAGPKWSRPPRRRSRLAPTPSIGSRSERGEGSQTGMPSTGSSPAWRTAWTTRSGRFERDREAGRCVSDVQRNAHRPRPGRRQHRAGTARHLPSSIPCSTPSTRPATSLRDRRYTPWRCRPP